MHPSRLHTKFLVLVLGTLIVFLLAVSYFIIQREAALLERKSTEKHKVLAFTIYSNLRDNMMQGTPRSTVKLMNSIRGASGLVRLDAVKPDGTPAFGMSGSRMIIPELQAVLASGKEISYRETSPVLRHTILFPLKNDSECKTCHGANGPILGILLISLSLQDSMREIESSTKRLGLSLSVLILVIGIVLYLLVRKVILQPLARLYDGAERIGRGDLSHRISLSTNDEIQELAGSFNVMAAGLEESHRELENRISERTAQLSKAVTDVREKARKLYEYSRDIAVISRVSRKVFNAEQPVDKLLDQCMWAVSRGLRYNGALLFLIDHKRAWLELKRDSGLGDLIRIDDQSVAGNEPFAAVVRAGRDVYIEDIERDPVFNRYRRFPFPDLSALHIVPILTGTRYKKCWNMLECTRADCPAYHRHDQHCWMVEKTLCRNAHIESYGDKLAYCMSCEIFPVLGVLVVGARPSRGFPKRNVSVLRILAANIGAALENHRLYDANRQLVRQLLELHKATASALAELSLERALEAFADSAANFSGQDAYIFWLVSKDGLELVRKAGNCADGTGDVGSFPDRLPVREGVLGRAYQRNNVLTEYRASANDATQLGKVLASRGFLSLLAVPLNSEGRSLGVFSVHKKSSTPFLDSEITAFQLLAGHAALALNVCMLNEELKNQNRELSRDVSFIGRILSSMSSGVMLLDMTGTVQLVNEAGAALLHSSAAHLLKRRLTDLYPDAKPFFESSIGPSQEAEIVLGDDAKIPIGFSSAYYRGANGELEGILVVYRDLTEIKSLRAEVITKERFAAMGRVVGGVAHEIRNPLFGISSIGQIFERELINPAHQKLARALISETKRLNQLVEELLIYGRPMKLQLVQCDLTVLWDEVVQMNREEIDKKGIAIRSDNFIPHVACLDAHQIKQVFLNLLGNAIHSMREGGEIVTSLRIDDPYVIFSVADTGDGIPDENIEKVFDLFFTTKPKGTGLGLAICRKIIQDHGGDISIQKRRDYQSEKPGGTIVTLKLPHLAAESMRGKNEGFETEGR